MDGTSLGQRVFLALYGGTLPKLGLTVERELESLYAGSPPQSQRGASDERPLFVRELRCREIEDVTSIRVKMVDGNLVPDYRGSDRVCASAKLIHKWDSADWQIPSPIYYFAGAMDPATFLDQQTYHFHGQHSAPKYFIYIPEAGHATESKVLGDCYAKLWDAIAAAASPANALSGCRWFFEHHAKPLVERDEEPLAKRELRDAAIHLALPYVDPAGAEGKANAIVLGFFTPSAKQTIGLGATKAGGFKAPDGRTIFEIQSVTKTFTGLVLADEIGCGMVRLSDKPGGRPYTYLDLATHYSGLPLRPDRRTPVKNYTAEQLFSFLDRVTLLSQPGAEFHYSNVGMAYLGLLESNIAGKPYEELVTERVTAPLGMLDTRVTLNEEQKARAAQGYVNGEEVPLMDFGEGMVAAGGLRSDRGRFAHLSRSGQRREGNAARQGLHAGGRTGTGAYNTQGRYDGPRFRSP
jgi:hypothetical protein